MGTASDLSGTFRVVEVTVGVVKIRSNFENEER